MRQLNFVQICYKYSDFINGEKVIRLALNIIVFHLERRIVDAVQ